MANVRPLSDGHKPSVAAVLESLFEYPELPAVVRRLDGPTFLKLLDRVGLEDAGALVALAAPWQLEQLLDADVWRNERPGEAERFDARRVGLWLEILLDADPQTAMRTLAAMDESFLALALARLVRVFDVDRLQEIADTNADGDETDRFQKVLEGLPQHEFDEYLVVAREEDAWDAILELLTGLYEREFALFDRLMRRCARATASDADEAGGYAHLLTYDEELFEEAAAERDARREREGFVEPVAAKTFLRVLERERVEEILAEEAINPVVDSYLGVLRTAPDNTLAKRSQTSLPARVAVQIAAIVRAEEELQGANKALPAAAEREGYPRLTDAMRSLRAVDVESYYRCKREFAFLANVFLSGRPARDGRKMRAAEAAAAVLETCDRGLSRLNEHAPGKKPEDLLSENFGVVTLFRLGTAQAG